MSTLRVNNIQLNQEGNAAITIANSYNVVISVDGTQKIKLHRQGIDFSSGITINNVPVIDGSGGLLSIANPGTSGNVLTSNGTAWISQTLPTPVVTASPGTSGNVLTSNGTAWISSQPVSQKPILTGVASGTINIGAPVIINDDGTISAVSGSNLVDISNGTSNTVIDIVQDSVNNKVVVLYGDGATALSAVVGTISNNSVSFGTPVVVRSGTVINAKQYVTATYDSVNGKVVISYRDGSNSNYGTTVIGTVSGTSISFGTPVVFSSTGTNGLSSTYDTNTQKVVISYGTTNFNAIVGTVSGTSISFGSAGLFASGAGQSSSTIFDNVSKKIVITYRDVAAGGAKGIVATVSGTSLSFGAEVSIGGAVSATNPGLAVTYDSDKNKIIFVYTVGTALYARTLTVSGTGIDIGPQYLVQITNFTSYVGISAAYDSFAKRTLIAYSELGSYTDFYAGWITMVGTSNSNNAIITYESTEKYIFDGFYSSSRGPILSYNSNSQKTILAYTDAGDGDTGRTKKSGVVVLTRGSKTNLRYNNYLGLSAGTYSNGQTATIHVGGAVNESQSNLSVGKTYYVFSNGILSTAVSGIYSTKSDFYPEIIAGVALSANNILIR